MKKNTMFKILAIMMFVVALLSWIITSTMVQNGQLINVGLGRVSLYQLFYYPVLAVQFFLQPLLFILAVGGLYGILAKTGKYRNKLEKIAKSMKGKEEIFLIVTSLVLAVLSSVFGFSLLLFTFIPALCGIIILMGYDKITAFLTTFISPLIGIIGSTYGFYVVGYINQVTASTFKTQILFKVLLFVVSYIIYIAFLIKHSRKALENKKDKNENDSKDEELPFLGEKKQSKKAGWPIFVIMGMLLLLTILGCTAWVDTYETTFFTDLHKAVTEWSIGDHAILSYLIQDLESFGQWYLTEITVMIIIASVIISSVYNLKVSEGLKAFGEGVQKVLKPAALVVFAFTITIITAYHPYFVTITDWMINLISGVSGILGDLLFILFAGLNTIISTVLNIDMIYVVQSSVQIISTDATEVLAVLTQALFGVTLIIAPTSTMLILGLEYLGIPYKDWLKSSWKLVLSLLAVSLVIVTIIMFITK